MDYISQFTTDIRHISGKENTVADALSRYGVNTVRTPAQIDFAKIARAQEEDEELQQLQSSTSSLQFEKIPLHTSDGSIIVDVSTGTARPYIPKAFRRLVFDTLHILSIQAFELHSSWLLHAMCGPVSTEM